MGRRRTPAETPEAQTEQDQSTPAETPEASEFICVSKDGEELMIHPDAEADHNRLGWFRV